MLAADGFPYEIRTADVDKSEREYKQRAYAEKNIGYRCRRGGLRHSAPCAEERFQNGTFPACRLYAVNNGEKGACRLGGKMAEISADCKEKKQSGKVSEDVKEVYRHKV